MKKFAWHFFRISMGLLFFVYGLNGVYQFIPVPEQSDIGQKFLNSMFETGYMKYVWKIPEVFCGFLFLANRWVLLGSVLLAPVCVNIFLYHLVLSPNGLPVGVFLLAGNVYILWSFREHYSVLWQPNLNHN